MPQGTNPPDPGLPPAVFNALHAMTYDAAALAFKDGSGQLYYLFVEKVTGGAPDQGSWFYGKDSEGGLSPRGQIPQLTFDVVKNGTYNTGTGRITYNGSSYLIRLIREASSGKHLAQAHVA